ncbi:unnamed protein product [Parnassius mnemosyne]|uniref:RING-type domain-containing protein n=1 Tax=Parnassius mnemosyne TaxID=213953 RepID=A0AAV1M080_9NEOP
MISVVTNLVNLIATVTQWVFVTASVLGKLIVAVISTIFGVFYESAQRILLFFQIVYEDNVTIFTEELPNLTIYIIETAVKQWYQVQNYLNMMYYGLVDNFKLIFGLIYWSFEEIFVVISDIFMLWKKTFIFLGETLWLMLTFIPIHLPQIMREMWISVSGSIYHVMFHAYMSLLHFTNFLTDVPLESFIGILITMIIVRLCLHFRFTLRSQMSTVYWNCKRKVLYLYYTIYNYFNDYETRLIAQMSGGQQMTTQEEGAVQSADEVLSAAEALCIICQERPKCVLILPCRHVCLCTECCMRLYGYQRTCPICRTFIYHSVPVYL